MKKGRVSLMLVATSMLLILGACGGKEEVRSNADVKYSETHQIVSVSEKGVFYKKNELVRFRPEGSEESIVFCYDPDCLHEPASHENPDPTCNAALFEGRTDITYFDGYLYYFVDDGIYKHKIYRKAVDGSGREQIAELPYSQNAVRAVTFRGDKMYYPVNEVVTDEVNNTQTITQCLIEYNLTDGTYREMIRKPGESVSAIQVTDNYVFIRLIDNADGGNVYLERLDLDTLEEEILIDKEEFKKRTFVRACDDNTFLYYEFDNIVGMRDIKKGKDTVLIDDRGKGQSGLLTASGNGIFYCLYDYDKENGYNIIGYYFYDIAAGKMNDITEKGIEYELTGYDGYNKVFRSGSMFDIMVISEDKILGDIEK